MTDEDKGPRTFKMPIAVGYRGHGRTEEAVQSTLDFVESGEAQTIDWHSTNAKTSRALLVRFVAAAQRRELRFRPLSGRRVRFEDGTVVRFVVSSRIGTPS